MIYNLQQLNDFQYLLSSLKNKKNQRKFQAYCIGTPKSGTHSLASIFNNYLVQHEPDWQYMLNIIAQEHLKRIQHNNNNYFVTDKSYRMLFLQRDCRLKLELESSHLLGPFVKIIADVFPEAKFILTIRDCYTWIDSMINDELNTQSLKLRFYWKKAYDFYFGAEKYTYESCEKILKDNNLYPISAYINYWKQHNEGIINSLSPDRLLIIKTNEIKSKSSEIYKFLNCQYEENNNYDYHSYRCKHKHNLLNKLPRKYLLDKVNQEAGDLMAKYFDDANINLVYS